MLFFTVYLFNDNYDLPIHYQCTRRKINVALHAPNTKLIPFLLLSATSFYVPDDYLRFERKKKEKRNYKIPLTVHLFREASLSCSFDGSWSFFVDLSLSPSKTTLIALKLISTIPTSPLPKQLYSILFFTDRNKFDRSFRISFTSRDIFNEDVFTLRNFETII